MRKWDELGEGEQGERDYLEARARGTVLLDHLQIQNEVNR